jgi:DNA polymerase (family 10)
MPMSNAGIAEAFREMADLLEISGGANPFRVRAYRSAADTIQDEPRALGRMSTPPSAVLQTIKRGTDLCSRRIQAFTTRPAGRRLLEHVAGAARANGWR